VSLALQLKALLHGLRLRAPGLSVLEDESDRLGVRPVDADHHGAIRGKGVAFHGNRTVLRGRHLQNVVIPTGFAFEILARVNRGTLPGVRDVAVGEGLGSAFIHETARDGDDSLRKHESTTREKGRPPCIWLTRKPHRSPVETESGRNVLEGRAAQFSVGLSRCSITSTSTGLFCLSSRRPSCSCNAVTNGGPGASVASLGDHSSVKS